MKIKKLEDKYYAYEFINEAYITCSFRLPPEITDKINEIIEEINKLKKE